jgi:Uma2 family endonuclease
LQAYVLVSQAEPAIEMYRRTSDGRWELLEARSGERIDLASLGTHLDVDAIYANPLMPPPA